MDSVREQVGWTTHSQLTSSLSKPAAAALLPAGKERRTNCDLACAPRKTTVVHRAFP